MAFSWLSCLLAIFVELGLGRVWVKHAVILCDAHFDEGVLRFWLSEAKCPCKFPIRSLSGRIWQHNWAFKSDLRTTGIACLLWDILWHQIGKRWCEMIHDGTWTFRQTQPNQSIRWSKSSENTWAMSLPTSSSISTKLSYESPERMSVPDCFMFSCFDQDITVSSRLFLLFILKFKGWQRVRVAKALAVSRSCFYCFYSSSVWSKNIKEKSAQSI